MHWLSRRRFTVGAGALGVLGSTRGFGAGQPELDFDPVSSPQDVRPVVWSWTTTEQAAELRNDRVLLTRATSPTLGRGYLFEVLSARADPLSKVLNGSRFEKGRFGWVNAWATCLGFAGEAYGPELLRIELKPAAWLALVTTTNEEVNVVDLAGRPVAGKAALAEPHRLAGVVFINDEYRFTTGSTCVEPSGSASHGGTWREVYVGNLAQVANWSLGTDLIRQRIDDDRSLLARFATFLGRLDAGPVVSCRWPYNVSRCRWTARQSEPVGRYEASLAFLEPQYAPAAANVERLATEFGKRLFIPQPLRRRP